MSHMSHIEPVAPQDFGELSRVAWRRRIPFVARSRGVPSPENTLPASARLIDPDLRIELAI